METRELELGGAELWFCAPNTPAKGKAQRVTFGNGWKERHVWVRAAPSSLAPLQKGRPAFEIFLQEETEAGLSCVLRRSGILYWQGSRRAHNPKWRQFLVSNLAGDLGRAWRPQSDERFSVVLDSSGKGAVFGHDEMPGHYCSTKFKWSESAPSEKFLRWPQSEFDAFFQAQWDNRSSALHCAYKWHGWSEDERSAHVCQCQKGTWQELRHIAHSVLVLSFREDDEDELGYRDDVWQVFSSQPFAPDNDILQRWREVFERVFCPRAARDDVPDYELFYRFTQQGVFPARPQIKPSAHEKIEAHLHLKEWLERNAPDEAARLLDFSR